MTTQDNEKIISKIKKLLAMADQSGGASEQERETAMRQANAMMDKHNIELSDTVETTDTGQDEHHIGSTIWKAYVLSAVAKLYGCESYRTNGASGQMFIIGLEHNRQVTASMSEYLIKSIKREAKKYEGESRRFLNNFRKGAAIGITQQTKRIITERKEAARQAKQQVTTTGTAIAIAIADYYNNQLALNDQYLRDQGVKLKSSGTSISDSDGYNAGKSYGSNVSLNGQLG